MLIELYSIFDSVQLILIRKKQWNFVDKALQTLIDKNNETSI